MFFFYWFLSASLKSFLEIIERDFSHLRGAVFLVSGLESASLLLDGRRGEKVIKSRCWSMEMYLCKEDRSPLSGWRRSPELGQHSSRDREVGLLATSACSQGLSSAFLYSECCLWPAWKATRGARVLIPPVPPIDMQALIFFLGSFHYDMLLWNQMGLVGLKYSFTLLAVVFQTCDKQRNEIYLLCLLCLW